MVAKSFLHYRVEFREPLKESIRTVAGIIRRYVSTRTTALFVAKIYDYGSVLPALLDILYTWHGKVLVPLKLTKPYGIAQRVVSAIKKSGIASMIYEPGLEKQRRLLDKLAFKKIKLKDRTIPVKRISVRYLRLMALGVILKSVTPRRASDYRSSEQSILVDMYRSGFLARYVKGRHVYYVVPERETFIEAVLETRRRWEKFRSKAYDMLLDIGLYNSREDMYIKYKSIASADIERMLNTYKFFTSLPVRIIDPGDEVLGELLQQALNNPAEIYALPIGEPSPTLPVETVPIR